MPREWRFNARSCASPTKCAEADPHGFPADLLDAFVDRLPIGWRALDGRGSTTRERELIDDLRWLDRVRRPAAPADAAYPADAPRDGSRIAVGLVLAGASAQTALCFAIVAGAIIGGHSVVRESRLLLAAGFAAGASMLAAAAARDRRTLGLLAALVCVSGVFARGATYGLPLPHSPYLRFALYGVLPVTFAPAALWQFTLAFPPVHRFTLFDVVARRAMWFAWGLGGVLFTATMVSQLGMTRLAAMLGRGGSSHTFWNLFAMLFLPPVMVLAVRARRSSADERRRIVRFAVVLAAGGTPLLAMGLFRMLVPGLDRWFVASGPTGHVWLDRVVLWPLAATPILSSAVLLLDRPFESQATPRVPSRNHIARAALWAGLLTPFTAFAVLLYQLRHVTIARLADIGGWPFLTAGLGSVAVLALAWLLAAGGIVVVADERRRVSSALARVRRAHGERDLATRLAADIAESIQATFGRAMFPAADGRFVDPSAEIDPLTQPTALSRVFMREPGAIDVSDRGLGPLLPAPDRAWIAANEVLMAAALRDRTGAPRAVLVFGKKRTGCFGPRERWLTTTLVEAAAGVSRGDERRRRSPQRAHEEPAFECRNCGTVARSLTPACGCGSGLVLSALPARLAGRFMIDRRLAAGGMGVAYRGRDIRLQRDVALKTVPALRGEEASRLRREARAMAALNHDALATLYGLELWRGTPILVEEYLAGGTLADRLSAGPLCAWNATTIVLRIADAIAYMHGRGTLHGDVKPDNIGFTAARSAKLLDFGLSTLIGSAVPGCAGTPDYLPPECASQTTVAPSLDLWALSVTFLEAIAGREARRAARAPKALAALLESPSFAEPAGLRLFFTRALALDPRARFSTATEMCHAIRRLELSSTRN
jgi:hypothetical protein